jgi:hypothetical protein
VVNLVSDFGLDISFIDLRFLAEVFDIGPDLSHGDSWWKASEDQRSAEGCCL